jgi:hypothetical protein
MSQSAEWTKDTERAEELEGEQKEQRKYIE